MVFARVFEKESNIVEGRGIVKAIRLHDTNHKNIIDFKGVTLPFRHLSVSILFEKPNELYR